MIIVKTPLRISFFGGGTDFPEYFNENSGAVLGVSIDKYIYHSISHFPSYLFPHKLRFSYRKVECVNQLDQMEHAPCREILRYCGVSRDVEINLSADLPSFSGLGSSSSFTVGLIKGIHALNGQHIGAYELAQKAIFVEREILGEVVGLQDQIFASYGGFNLIKFSSANTFSVERLVMQKARLKELQQSLMLIYTGISRRASVIEKEKIENLTCNATHLEKLFKLVDKAHKVLTGQGNLSEFGLMLNETWMKKKQLSNNVSSTDIDSLYDRGIKAGALGGKLLGAGGGGFMLFFIPPENRIKVRLALSEFHEVPFLMDGVGSSIIHS